MVLHKSHVQIVHYINERIRNREELRWWQRKGIYANVSIRATVE
jgi:hypothetical protein